MKRQPAAGPVRVSLKSDLKAAARLPNRIAKQLERTSFDPREIFGMKLALEEALVNAIKHGNRLDPAKKVKVVFQVLPERFEIRIADEGPGYDPGLVRDCQADENLTRPAGRGLLLMRHYMTEVVVHPPGNQLSMTKVRTNGHAHAAT